MTHFEALYGYKPNLLPALEGHTIVVAIEAYLQQRQEVLSMVKEELAKARNMMKQQVYRKKSEREFSMGDEVYLRLRYPHLKSIT